MTPAIYGARYAEALKSLVKGPDSAAEIARKFRISPRQAKYLQVGKNWTLYRLEQAAEIFGDAWDIAIQRPATDWQHNLEMAELKARIARVEAHIDEMAREAHARMASRPGDQGDCES